MKIEEAMLGSFLISSIVRDRGLQMAVLVFQVQFKLIKKIVKFSITTRSDYDQ